MNNLGILFRYEWKKLWKKKIVWIMGAIVSFSFLCSNLSFLIPYETVQTDCAGNSKKVQQGGYKKHVIACENARKLDGRKIDEELLKEVWKDYDNEEYEEIKNFLWSVDAENRREVESSAIAPLADAEQADAVAAEGG